MELSIQGRVDREREVHERGLQRGLYSRVLRHTAHRYLQHRKAITSGVMRAAEGGRVLELGSMAWVRFLEEASITPAELTCINIAERELANGQDRAKTSRLKPTFKIMDAHRLAFPDASLDVVYGVAILHHLDLDRALAEIERVLRPGGLFVFAEPLDNNPVGRLVRLLTPAARTEDERPFRYAQLDRLRRQFGCRLHYEQLLSVPAGVASGLIFNTPDNGLTRLAYRLDEGLLRRWPALGPYFRHVLAVGGKAEAPGS